MKYPAYEKYKDSGISWLKEVPEHWPVLSIKRLTPVQRGASPRPIQDRKYFDDEGEYAWVRIADVTANNRFLLETTQRLSELGKSCSVPLEPGQLFLSIAGSVGKPMISKIKCCIHDGFVYFPYLKENHEFLFFIFMSGQPYLGLGKLGTQLNLNTDTVGDIKIGLPLENEQKRIVEFLSYKTAQIDCLIEKKQALIEKLNEKRTGMITRVVTKGLDESVPMKDSGVEWLRELPKQWSTIKVRYCTNFITSGPRGWAKFFSDEGSFFIRIANLSRNSISLTMNDVQKVSPPLGAEGERTSTKEGDVLVSITADLGSTAVISKEYENAYISQHIAIIRPEIEKIHPKWLAFSFFAISGKAQLLCSGYGGTKIQLGLNDINNVTLALPDSMDEQTTIIELIESRIEKIDNLKEKISDAIKRLKEYRTALITAAVTGKIDVRNFRPNQVQQPAREAA